MKKEFCVEVEDCLGLIHKVSRTAGTCEQAVKDVRNQFKDLTIVKAYEITPEESNKIIFGGL